MNHISVQSPEYDPSEDDGINIVLIGGALVCLLLLSAALYVTYRVLQKILKKR